MSETDGGDWRDQPKFHREMEALRAGLVEQAANIDQLLVALRDLIDRIPPKNLKR